MPKMQMQYKRRDKAKKERRAGVQIAKNRSNEKVSDNKT